MYLFRFFILMFIYLESPVLGLNPKKDKNSLMFATILNDEPEQIIDSDNDFLTMQKQNAKIPDIDDLNIKRTATIQPSHQKGESKSLRRSKCGKEEAGDSTAISSSESTSSSLETQNWKEAFRHNWLEKKIVAFKKLQEMNATGDSVKMVAARPWGISCGDPSRQDMPWGSCLLATECPSEFRIYRGDAMCGRTQFICCAILSNNYDLNVAVSMSLEDSELKSESSKSDSEESKKRRRKKQKLLRKKDREKRKKKIKKEIDKIVKLMKRTLKKMSSNATSERKKRTKQLKRYIAHLKRQYKRDKWSIIEIHEKKMFEIDKETKNRIWQIRDLTRNFGGNETFREIVKRIMYNNSISREDAYLLVQSFPELKPYLRLGSRRSYADGNIKLQRDPSYDNDGQKHDAEYGYVYY